MRERPTWRALKTLVIAAFLGATNAYLAIAQPPPPPPSGTPKSETKGQPKPKDSSNPASGTTTKASTAKPKANDDQPIVMSVEAYARSRGKLGEKDRYGSEPDWAALPPWKQTSFFGIRAEGQLFIYVIDCSGSMADEDRLDRAKSELRRSIGALQSPQRFKVIFYNDRPIPMPGDLPKPADYPSKAQLARWFNMVEPEGPTDPKSSLALALAMKPDAVFLLSDGAFPEGTAEAITKLNPKKIPIHCVDLANGAAGDDLKKIATESGGQYAAKGR